MPQHSAEEVLELRKLVGTGEAESQSSIDRDLAEGLAGHTEELDQILVFASMCGDLDDFQEVGSVSSTDVRFNGVRDTETIQLCLRNPAPHFRCVYAVRKFVCFINRHNVIDQNVDSLDVVVMLLEDLESLIKHADLDTLLCNVVGAVLVKLLDVPDDPAAVRLAGGKHQQVLERRVIAEAGRLQDDLLQ
jgi:hypothetical protein